MRPRPTSATNHQLVAVAMFLFTGCLWWTVAPFMQEDFGHMRTALGLDREARPAFAAQIDEGSAIDWSATPAGIPMHHRAFRLSAMQKKLYSP